MASKKRSPVADYLVYLAIRCAVCVLQTLSLETAYSLAKHLGWVIYRVNKRHRLVAHDNIAKAYPGQFSDAQIDAMVRQVYVHFCRLLMEIVLMPRKLHISNWKNYATLEGSQAMMGALLADRPLLIVTGHFGNWEIAGYALNLFGFRTHAIARPIDNPYLDQYLRDFREGTGQKILAKQGDFDQIEKVLADGGTLATLADQDAGERGVFVPYFGRPASTHKAVALMAMEHKVPMVVCGTMLKGEKYHIVPADVIFPEEYERSPEAIKEITQRFTSDLEQLVRQAPEQYFWVHRRWKSQPAVRVKKKKAAA